ncbi:unnamed protein product [Musa acuminata subsp. burmannicoides]
MMFKSPKQLHIQQLGFFSSILLSLSYAKHTSVRNITSYYRKLLLLILFYLHSQNTRKLCLFVDTVTVFFCHLRMSSIGSITWTGRRRDVFKHGEEDRRRRGRRHELLILRHQANGGGRRRVAWLGRWRTITRSCLPWAGGDRTERSSSAMLEDD